jgi:uncharacterized BrkB/YihY/UPF0761 family membrane protein
MKKRWQKWQKKNPRTTKFLESLWDTGAILGIFCLPFIVVHIMNIIDINYIHSEDLLVFALSLYFSFTQVIVFIIAFCIIYFFPLSPKNYRKLHLLLSTILTHFVIIVAHFVIGTELIFGIIIPIITNLLYITMLHLFSIYRTSLKAN